VVTVAIVYLYGPATVIEIIFVPKKKPTESSSKKPERRNQFGSQKDRKSSCVGISLSMRAIYLIYFTVHTDDFCFRNVNLT
jgi:hypothetical protein